MQGPSELSNPLTVRLEPYELEQAMGVAVRRIVDTITTNVNRTKGMKDDALEWCSVIGSAAEMAVAKHLRTFWNGAYHTFHAPDIGRDIQVRARLATNEYPRPDLIVRDDDPPDHRYVLAVTYDLFEFALVGWIHASEAMKDCYWRTERGRPPMWYVPWKDLNPFTRSKAA